MPPKKLSKPRRGRRLQLSQLPDAADRAKSIGNMNDDNTNNDLGEDDPEHLTKKVTEIDQYTAANTRGITNTPNNITASSNPTKGQVASDIGAHLAQRLTAISIPSLSMATRFNEKRRATYLRIYRKLSRQRTAVHYKTLTVFPSDPDIWLSRISMSSS
jgi:hypothetical protein